MKTKLHLFAYLRGRSGQAGRSAALLSCAFLFFAAGCGGRAAISADGARVPYCPGCNVILVSLDTLRADSLGTYGYSRKTSPNLDRLARRGTVFLNAWSQSPDTFPSHMSIFTSQYPWTHGVEVLFKDRLSTDTVTLAMALQARGYRTVWAAPRDNPHLSLTAGFERGFDVFASGAPLLLSRSHFPRNWRLAFRWLKENKDSKFFMFLYSAHVHDPYTQDRSSLLRFPASAFPSMVIPPEEFESWVAKNIAADPRLAPFEKAIKDNPGIFAMSDLQKKRAALLELAIKADLPPDPYTVTTLILQKLFADSPGDVASYRAAYDAGIFETDMMIDALYKNLEELRLADKTLLVLTSEHGEEFMEHGKLRHTQLYAENLHVPLIFLFPERDAGKRIARTVQNIDIAPTILEAVGAPGLPKQEGRSLLPLIEGVDSSDPDPLTFAGPWQEKYSVRDSRYTYMVRNTCVDNFASWNPACLTEEFYDRLGDPGELHNIIDSNRTAAGGFAARLSEKLNSAVKGPGNPWPEGISEEAKKRILDTGYW